MKKFDKLAEDLIISKLRDYIEEQKLNRNELSGIEGLNYGGVQRLLGRKSKETGEWEFVKEPSTKKSPGPLPPIIKLAILMKRFGFEIRKIGDNVRIKKDTDYNHLCDIGSIEPESNYGVSLIMPTVKQFAAGKITTEKFVENIRRTTDMLECTCDQNAK
jgi:hypothetical protein